jgi:hypothetical protein
MVKKLFVEESFTAHEIEKLNPHFRVTLSKPMEPSQTTDENQTFKEERFLHVLSRSTSTNKNTPQVRLTQSREIQINRGNPCVERL